MRVIFGSILLLLASITTPAIADDWGPWEVSEQTQKPNYKHNSTLETAVKLFQKYLSPVDGQRCAMYPTCSAYSLQALQKHGSFLGVFLTVDRLYHEGDPVEQQHPVNKWGYIRFYDPLENNDFWLEK